MQTFVLKLYWFSSLFAFDKLFFELNILVNTIHRHPQFTTLFCNKLCGRYSNQSHGFVVVLIFYSLTSVVRDLPALCSKQCEKKFSW
jgi:hypothetical protein